MMIVKPGSTNTMSGCGCEGTVRTGVNPDRSFSRSGGTPIQEAKQFGEFGRERGCTIFTFKREQRFGDFPRLQLPTWPPRPRVPGYSLP